MKKCPECNNSWPEEHLYCPICGTDLVSERDGSGISMGNANAISGGVHSSDDHSKKDSDNVVNSNNETHTNSHNTTNNTTIYEAEKSASEKLEENRLKYRLECKKHFHEGLISREGELHLRELQVYLNLADELALPIKEEVRQQSRRRKTQLSSVGKNEIRLTKSIIEQNTISNLQRQLDKLEVYMQEYDDDALKLMYYQMSSMLEPVRYTNRYEDSAKDEYWEVYWAYIAYMLQERDKQAVEALVSLDRWHGYYHEQNCDILNIVGQLMQNELEETIKSKRDALNNYAPELKTLLEAIDELLEMDWTKESISIRPTHSFYINTLFGRFVETQKIIGKQRLIEIKEQERIKREEEERNKQAELKLQDQIRGQKATILQKFQETGKIETACQEAGVDSHTFNIWLEEDQNFAYSYNEIAQCMEIKRKEEAEKKRKQAEQEAVDTQQKQAFVTRYGANDCDMLKTCTEIGASMADCRRWRATDAAFNDQITYFEREKKALEREASNCRKKRMGKKLLPYLIAIIVIIAGCFAVKTCKDQKEAEQEERARQEEIERANKRKAQEEEARRSYAAKKTKFYNIINRDEYIDVEELSIATDLYLEVKSLEQEYDLGTQTNEMFSILKEKLEIREKDFQLSISLAIYGGFKEDKEEAENKLYKILTLKQKIEQ